MEGIVIKTVDQLIKLLEDTFQGFTILNYTKNYNINNVLRINEFLIQRPNFILVIEQALNTRELLDTISTNTRLGQMCIFWKDNFWIIYKGGICNSNQLQKIDGIFG